MVDLKKNPYKEERPLTRKLTKKLPIHLRVELSCVIDEIERSTYWETRREFIDRTLKHIEIGDAKKYFKYLKSKGKPQ